MLDDPYNALLELRRDIADALEFVERAGGIASDMATQDDGSPGWKAMGDLCDALAAVSNTLRTITPQEITTAMIDAEKYLDDLADRADGQSY